MVQKPKESLSVGLEGILSDTRHHLIELLQKIIDAFSINDLAKISENINKVLEELYFYNKKIEKEQIEHALTNTDNASIQKNTQVFTKVGNFLNDNMKPYIEDNAAFNINKRQLLENELRNITKDIKEDSEAPTKSRLGRH